jgi:hypothetical protein
MYSTPKEFCFRLHHIRPRFKGDIENVLIFLAKEFSKIPKLPSEDFKQKANESIKQFPGNIILDEKTINNWRTEISALFGFIESDDSLSWCGKRAIELMKDGDLVKFFKIFLFNFQYPGGYLKSDKILKLIQNKVHFKPAQFILKLLQYANDKFKNKNFITKAESCHLLFNDLRILQGKESFSSIWNRIESNRKNGVEYYWTGDVIRYASDIIDYMVIANLLVSDDEKAYYINDLEKEVILKFINSTEWFSKYDNIDEHLSEKDKLFFISSCRQEWFKYVNREINSVDFSTDIFAFISKDNDEYKKYAKKSENKISAKEIGDVGENIIFGHECEKLRIGNRKDLIHLIKKIPAKFAVGYDIISLELESETKRYIEVKTTISSKSLDFNKIHLTTNEWVAADSNKDRYFIYRLMISKEGRKLFIIQNPVGLYKKDIINMIPRDGADISFKSNDNSVGYFEELLLWNGNG